MKIDDLFDDKSEDKSVDVQDWTSESEIAVGTVFYSFKSGQKECVIKIKDNEDWQA